MHPSLIRSLLCAIAVSVFAMPAFGQSRDEAANRTIDLAINQHYLSTDFDTALKLLTATIQGCEGVCTPKTLARAWIYQGIVLGAGKNDLASAKDAFISALALDPDVSLDRNLATPEVARMFEELGGKNTAATTAAKPEKPATTATPEGATSAPAGSGLNCNLKVSEVETRRPIPIQCRTEQDASQVHLRYRTNGNKIWVSVAMTKQGNAYVTELPCKETENAGALELYVLGEDANGEDVATFGTKANPVKINLVETSQQEPPSYDNTEPPARCGAKQECPPDFPGCSAKKVGGDVDWGNGCDNSSQCKAGLMCIDGTCETAPTCQTDDDCDAGRCVQGICNASAEGGGARSYRKNWFGVSFAQDIAILGGQDLCSQANQTDKYTACYYSGSTTAPYMNEPYPGVNVATGMVAATSRILLNYDRAFTPNITAGVRIGFALGGGPANGRSVTYGAGQTVTAVTAEGTKFNPFHLEARAKYWFGNRPLARKVRPFVHLGGGMAEVDAKIKMTVYDCGPKVCGAGVNPRALPSVDLDAWKKLGLEFVTIGGGLVYALQDRYGIQVDMNLMYMLPSSGVVLEPSIGFVAGL